ncbi:MAG: DUF1439 domain-containing protein [Deltaproteobacteria bacterium]|nr:DUF1439 domain-containing protein [Deltaproteobacteria bacterium]
MSESDIREKLDKKLPLTKSYFFIIQITLQNPRILLENGTKRVNAGLDVLLNIKIDKNPKPLGGSVDVSGGVRYLAEKGEFYLTDPVIESLGVQGIPDKYMQKVNKALTKALAKYYDENPIYTLNLGDGKQAVARMVLKDVVVENKELVVTLGI